MLEYAVVFRGLGHGDWEIGWLDFEVAGQVFKWLNRYRNGREKCL